MIGCTTDQHSVHTGTPDETQTVITPISTKKLECGHTNTPIDVNVHIFVRYEEEPENKLPPISSPKPKADSTKKKLPLNTDPQKIQDDVMCVGCDDDDNDEQNQDSPIDFEIELNPATGDYNVIIRDLQLD